MAINYLFRTLKPECSKAPGRLGNNTILQILSLRVGCSFTHGDVAWPVSHKARTSNMGTGAPPPLPSSAAFLLRPAVPGARPPSLAFSRPGTWMHGNALESAASLLNMRQISAVRHRFPSAPNSQLRFVLASCSFSKALFLRRSDTGRFGLGCQLPEDFQPNPRMDRKASRVGPGGPGTLVPSESSLALIFSIDEPYPRTAMEF